MRGRTRGSRFSATNTSSRWRRIAFYADATRSIEYGALAGFFAKGARPAGELADYFGSFDLIVSYLFDPDGIFAAQPAPLRQSARSSSDRRRSRTDEHAALQLARPLRTTRA